MWKNKVVTDVMVVIRIVLRVMMVVVMVMMMVVMVPSVKARMTNDGDPGDWLALAPASAVYLLLLDQCKQISFFFFKITIFLLYQDEKDKQLVKIMCKT